MVQIYSIANTTDYFWLLNVRADSNVTSDVVEIMLEAKTGQGKTLFVKRVISKNMMDNAYPDTLSSWVHHLSTEFSLSFGSEVAHAEIAKGLRSVVDVIYHGYDHAVHKFDGADNQAVINFNSKSSMGEDDRINDLPGVLELAINPVTGEKNKIKFIIVNLNDKQGWTRHQIADWLETLDVDIEFKSPEELEAKRKAKAEQEALKKKQAKEFYNTILLEATKPIPVDVQEMIYKAFPKKASGGVLNKSDHSDHIHLSLDEKYSYDYWYSQTKKQPPLKKESKKLIDEGVVPTTDKWYTLGYVGEFKTEQKDDPGFKPYNYGLKPKNASINFKIDDYLKLLNGEQNDKG